MNVQKRWEAAHEPEDLARFFVRCANAGDAEGMADGTVTAEIARQQPDGTWLWIIDQPAIATGLK